MLDFREMTIAADDGAQLHAFVHDGTTVPVILLHDLGMDARYWLPFLEAMMRRVPTLAVAAVDLRGHGRSEVGTETSRKRMVKDLRKWTQQLDIDPPVVVGHGYGADIALAADFLTAVVAVNPALGRAPAPVPDELTLPAGVPFGHDAEAVRMCTVGATSAKELKPSRRNAPTFLALSDPADFDGRGLPAFVDLAEDVQMWKSGSRHLPLESAAGLAALVLGWIEEVQ